MTIRRLDSIKFMYDYDDYSKDGHRAYEFYKIDMDGCDEFGTSKLIELDTDTQQVMIFNQLLEEIRYNLNNPKILQVIIKEFP